MRKSIRAKLFTGFGLVLVLLVAICGVSFFFSLQTQDNASVIDTQSLPSMVTIGDLNQELSKLDRQVLLLVLEDEKYKRQQIHMNIEQKLASIASIQAEYDKQLTLASDRSIWERFKSDWGTYVNYVDKIKKATDEKKFEEGYILAGEAQVFFDSAAKYIDSLSKRSEESVKLATSGAVEATRTSQFYILVISLAAVLIGILSSIMIARQISNPLRQITRQIKAVANGDLTVEPVQLRSRDELGALARDVNEMVIQLRKVVEQVQLNAQQVAATSQQLTAGAEQTAHASEQIGISMQEVAIGTERQVTSVSHTIDIAEQISQGMEQILDSMGKVTESSRLASEKANQGNEVVQKTVEQMNEIDENVSRSAQVVSSLGEKSKEIGTIVSLITEIASQTNLLALNAAIEAARAGEQGRGFAVVADEVRKLAEQSGQAASKISALISVIQQETEHAVVAMKKGTTSVKEGMQLVQHTGEAFCNILEAVNDVAVQASGVSAIIERVNAGTQQMVTAMGEIASISEQSQGNTESVAAAVQEQTASMEEIAAAAQTLAQMAGELQDSISVFQLNSVRDEDLHADVVEEASEGEEEDQTAEQAEPEFSDLDDVIQADGEDASDLHHGELTQEMPEQLEENPDASDKDKEN